MREREVKEIGTKSGRMVNLQIHLQDIGKRVRLGRFWKIKKRENIFAYINSIEHYIWHFLYLYPKFNPKRYISGL